MQKQRHIPFGYHIVDGVMAKKENEADAVKWIYSQYLHGLSYLNISDIMSQKDIPYTRGNPCWNKHMVKRILENAIYLGNEKYPPIITTTEFKDVESIRASKRVDQPDKPYPDILRQKIFCTACGKQLYRHTKHKPRERWYCQNECTIPTAVSDLSIITQITALLNLAIADPDCISIPAAEPQTTSLEVTRLQNEINREMDKRDHDESKIKALILQCAAEKYNLCDDGEQQRTGERVRALFAASSTLTDLDTTLFESTVCKVFVDSNGIVTLELQNGQLLKPTN